MILVNFLKVEDKNVYKNKEEKTVLEFYKVNFVK